MYSFDRNEYERRMKWFLEARFGVFIHWGLYAIPARGEWVRSTEQMEEAGYMRYFYEFDPRLYDPSTWVRAAKRAGMKYIILTAKHHDGFCLFDTATTGFKSTDTKLGYSEGLYRCRTRGGAARWAILFADRLAS